MKKSIAIIAAIFVTSASFADEPTFESVQNEFRDKALALLSEQDVAVADLRLKIAKFAHETFGAYPDLMRQETEKRFKSLPEFPAANLAAYVEYQSLNPVPLPPLVADGEWLMIGWEPEKLAATMKSAVLSRQLVLEQYGRLAFINRFCPDRIYRNGEGTFPDLIVDSLGDLFVIEVEMTEIGVCKPVSVKWLKKK